jgi:hypothetical protein
VPKFVADSSTATGLAYAAPASGSLVRITTASLSSSSVSVNSCFSSTYDNYLIIVSNLVGSTGGDGVRLRMRVSGTDATGSNYSTFGRNMGAVDPNINATSETSFEVGPISSTLGGGGYIWLYNPFAATATTFTAAMTRHNLMLVTGGPHTLNTSYDSFTIFPTAGTFSGNISVYGLTK